MDIAPLLFPALRPLDRESRREALRRASTIPFNVLELLALAAGFIAIGILMRHAPPQGCDCVAAATWPWAALLLPLAAVILYLRTRRGIASMAHRA
jgi:hypothetical protein